MKEEIKIEKLEPIIAKTHIYKRKPKLRLAATITNQLNSVLAPYGIPTSKWYKYIGYVEFHNKQYHFIKSQAERGAYRFIIPSKDVEELKLKPGGTIDVLIPVPEMDYCKVRFVLGTYNRRKRNLEVQLDTTYHYKEHEKVVYAVKKVIEEFLRKNNYLIPAFDGGGFGMQRLSCDFFPEPVSRHKAELMDYDANKRKAVSEWKYDFVWWKPKKKLAEYIREMKNNNISYVGGRKRAIKEYGNKQARLGEFK